MDPLFDLTGKVALVTGAYRGLGFAIAQGLARAGATVVLNGRNPGALSTAQQLLHAQGLSAEAAVFDVSDRAAAREAVAAIERAHGHLTPAFSGGTRSPNFRSTTGTR